MADMDWAEKWAEDYFGGLGEEALGVAAALRNAKADGIREAANIVNNHLSKKVQTDNTYYERLAISELLEAAASKITATD